MCFSAFVALFTLQLLQRATVSYRMTMCWPTPCSQTTPVSMFIGVVPHKQTENTDIIVAPRRRDPHNVCMHKILLRTCHPCSLAHTSSVLVCFRLYYHSSLRHYLLVVAAQGSFSSPHTAKLLSACLHDGRGRLPNCSNVAIKQVVGVLRGINLLL